MLLSKAYRFRLYPTPEQETLFRQAVGACRFVYNLALDQRKLERHRSEPRRLTAYDQIGELGALKAELPWLKDVPHHPLCQSILDLDKAFTNFFEGRASFPQFRRRGDRNSFRYPDPKQFKVTPGRVFLPKAGWVDWVMHRPITGKPKTATVSREADGWFVSIQVAVEAAEPMGPFGAPVGIDLGIAKPMALSTGEVIDLPRTGAKERRRLARLQKTIARRQKGSRNRARAVRAAARFTARLARRRKDAAHKATTRIAKSHGIIVIEALKVKNMTASAAGTIEEPGRNVAAKSGLNRSLLDVAPGQIRAMLEYKARWYGAQIIPVNPAYTSQTCHACGCVDAGNRTRQAAFCCVSCGHVANADLNAAKNILRRGQEHPQTRIEPGNRRTSGDGLWIEPGCRSEAGTPRCEARKLGPEGPRVVTAPNAVVAQAVDARAVDLALNYNQPRAVYPPAFSWGPGSTGTENLGKPAVSSWKALHPVAAPSQNAQIDLTETLKPSRHSSCRGILKRDMMAAGNETRVVASLGAEAHSGTTEVSGSPPEDGRSSHVI